ncbi:MAG: DUF6055 domain-containing protein [Clostridia bacterium]
MKIRSKALISLIVALTMVLPCVPVVGFAEYTTTYLLRNVNAGATTEVSMDVYQTYETEHFQIFYDTDGANSSKVTSAYLSKCETVLENCWALYIDKMGMEPTSTSVLSSGDKTTQYKTNVILMGTGVEYYDLGANDWGAYGSVDTAGYPYFMCCLAAMDSPTVVAHEFGHAVHYAQGDNAWKDNIYLGPWFEAVANWFAEQYIYEYMSGTTQLSHLYLRSNSLTKMNGRAYYEAWPILQYLTEDPDNTGVYGEKFVQKVLGTNLGSTNVLFWEVLEDANGDLTTADTVGMYASHMATMDFKNKTLYNNTINSAFSGNNFFWQQRYTMLEELGETGDYAVAPERAPQAMGYNIIPLDFEAGEVSVTLKGLTDAVGAGWTARLVKESSSGVTSYSDIFNAGETMSISVTSTDELYLTVAATPTLESMVRHTVGGWATHSTETNMPFDNKTQYPYSVTLSGAVPMERPTPSGTFKTHSNGGGKVATSASVASTAYVGPNAVVMGSATVSDNAIIDGYAIVAGSAKVSGNAYVGDTAVVFGSAQVTDNARVIENACIYGSYKVSGSAVVKGMSLGLSSGSATGEAIAYGDWFEDGGYSVAGGKFSGYHSLSSDSEYSILKIDNKNYRPYTNHLRARYEFNGNLKDTWANTELYGVNSPAVTENYANFTGEEYAVLDPSVLYYDNMKITLSVKGEGEVFSIGNGAIKLKIEGGAASLNGITSSAVCSTNSFNEIEVTINGTSAAVCVNGVETTGEIETSMLNAARSGKHYIGKGFSGSIDYIHIFDQSYVYDKEIGAMEGEFIKKLDAVENNETGTLNSKTSDTNSVWYGWSSTNTNSVMVDGGLNIKGSVNATITSPDIETDEFVIEFTPEGGSAYPDHGILDTDGDVLFAHRYATDAGTIHIGRGETNSSVRGTNSITDTSGQARLTNFVGERLCSGTIRADRSALSFSNGERVRIVAENTQWTDDLKTQFDLSENYTDNLASMTLGEDVYTVTYATVDNGLIVPVSVSVYKGHFTGFGGFKTAGGASGVTVSYKDIVVYSDSSNETTVTITYTVDGEPVKAVAKSYNPDNGETGAMFSEVYMCNNGENFIRYAAGGEYSVSQEVELGKLSNKGTSVGTYFEKDGIAYKTESANLIPNGDFEYNLTGWFNSANSAATNEYFTVNGDGTVTAKAHTGIDGKGSLYRAWTVENGKTYMFTYTSDVESTWHKTSLKDDISATNDGTVIHTSNAGENSVIFTATKNYLQINYRWLNSSNTLGNFALYEVANAESDRVVTTIKFMADETEIAQSKQINGFIGDVINLTDTTIVPNAITFGDKTYTKDDSNPSSYSANATGEVTITYTMSDIQSIETVSAIVIGDNLPILPKTLSATTADGNTAEVEVTDWDLSTLTTGENTVYATVNGTVLQATATVTVLPESFSLSDTSSKGNADNNIYFPTDLADEFYIEFDMVINKVSDTGANFGYNGSKWGSGAFGISPNGGNIKVTGGNKTGSSDGGTVLKSSVKAGETYRILVKADASTDTFSVYATGSDGTVGKAENKTFRKEQSPDCVNTINLRGNGTSDGDLEIRNVKVYSTSYVKAKFVNSDGEVIKEVTGDVSGGSFTVEGKEIFAIHTDGTGAFYNIPETNVTEHMTVVVDKVDNKYAVKADGFVNNNSANDSAEKDVRIMVAANDTEGVGRAPSSNADGVTISTGGAYYGSARVGILEFPIDSSMENKGVFLNVYVDGYKPNASGNSTCYIAAYTIENQLDAENLSLAYNNESFTSLSGPMFALQSVTASSNVINAIDKYVSIDVSEAVSEALSENKTSITFKLLAPHGGVYIADRDACIEGKAHDGCAAYLSLEDASTITVYGTTKVTKNGSLISTSSVIVHSDSTVKMYPTNTNAVAFTNGTKVYRVTDGVTEAITPEEGSYYPATIGINMVTGAQVRIGDGVTEEGKVDNGSGLRFITRLDLNDTLASITGATFGVKITAEGSENVVDIPAEKWQSADVFTTAITNLNETNYNRGFTATPYIVVDGQTFTGESVTRSIYTVASGILANGYTKEDNGTEEDKTDTEYILSKVLKDVLNAYVNQTGIRLTMTNDGTFTARTEGNGCYSGENIFFTVDKKDNGDGSYTVTIAPSTNVEIKSWWKEYVRINNNHSTVYNWITEDLIDENGTLTFKFTPVV